LSVLLLLSGVLCKDGLSGAFGSARVTCLYRAETASTVAYTR
jgi:hypothetical protein